MHRRRWVRPAPVINATLPDCFFGSTISIDTFLSFIYVRRAFFLAYLGE